MKTVIVDHRGPAPLVENRRFSAALVDDLKEILNDPIARGRRLAADSSYPPFSICEEIAGALLGSEISGRR